MRIAVAGAGFQGACIALELARRGHKVELFDRKPIPVTEAGLGNEGKVHLGLTYGQDHSHRTIPVMLKGALHFASHLNRWIGFSENDADLSTPFYYGVHPGSQLAPDEVIAHYERVQQAYAQMRAATGLEYLYQRDPVIFEDVSNSTDADHFTGSGFRAVFRTVERSVYPERIAIKLRDAINQHPSITFIGNAVVKTAAFGRNDRPMLGYDKDGQQYSDGYDQVVNALWAGRLELDATVSVIPRRSWLFRNKVGIVIRQQRSADFVPSLTVVLGSYGDIVNYQDGSYYLSWYPVCMVNKGSGLSIAPWDEGLDDARKKTILGETVTALSGLCPAVRSLVTGDHSTRIKGGSIFAWGTRDIDHVKSELHTRYDIGIQSHGAYHSINTGKYTMAPLYAVELADRIGS
jgi:hypothetical protein